MKKVLISIQPKWVEKICTKIGEEKGKPIYKKRIEVRKDRPKIETPFKCCIYCTYGKANENYMLGKRGKVIGEFVCDSVYEWKYRQLQGLNGTINTYFPIFAEDLLKTCLTHKDLENYGKRKTLYGWHISDLKIYDKPKELSEFNLAFHCFNLKNVDSKTNVFGDYVIKYQDNSFCRICKYYNGDFGDCDKPVFQPLKRPPKSWCYIEENENER